jgi:signal transduction histidine kinase
VLDFSKIEQGGVELSLAEVPVQRLVNEAADVIAPLVQRNDNLLQVLCPPDLGMMHTDAGDDAAEGARPPRRLTTAAQTERSAEQRLSCFQKASGTTGASATLR